MWKWRGTLEQDERVAEYLTKHTVGIGSIRPYIKSFRELTNNELSLLEILRVLTEIRKAMYGAQKT